MNADAYRICVTCGHRVPPSKDALRAIIAAQWERIVAAGATGDEHVVEWITEAVYPKRMDRYESRVLPPHLRFEDL